jgi:type I restriction enzyme R subunit
VQKFRDLLTETEARAPLNPAKNVFVLIDEAHRSQYGILAANMRAALPNACFLGFSGTPIDRKDRSTRSTFGPYLDTYTIQQAVADGATVPIFYESRMANLQVLGRSLDRLFERVFADLSAEHREAIKQRYATERAIAGAPRRIETISRDLLEHYTSFIQPDGFKAQIVAVSREAAVAYKETLDELHAPLSAVIISGEKGDQDPIARHLTTEEQRRGLIARFLDPADPLAILVVCDLLLTGFDAPVEQVMYLDAPLREHTLLQAIARVNRTAEGKDYGLVVDYWGVSGKLQEALDIFFPDDVKGAMTPKSDELPRLQGRHAAVRRFFLRVADKDDLEACLSVLRPEDVRAEFDVAFRRFTQSLDLMLPDPQVLPYVDDLRWLGKIRKAAGARFRDDKLDVSEYGAKVKKLIEESVVAERIQILTQRVSLFSKELDEKLVALKNDEAKASEMEHAILDEIHVKLDEMLGKDQTAAELGLSQTAHAVYGILHSAKALAVYEPTASTYDPTSKELASLIEEAIEAQVKIVDWTQKEDVQREMRKQIKRRLAVAGVTGEKAEELAKAILDLVRARQGR